MSTQAIVVVDLGFGDQGKGSLCDYLVRDLGAGLVVRFNGGAQAGHNVVTSDGRHHTFSQFGAGLFVPGVRSFLSRFMLLQPWAMSVEAEHLAAKGVPDAFERTMISRQALVITPFHRAANRLREHARRDQRHGSCGVGIGETVEDSLRLSDDLIVRARDLLDDGLLIKLTNLQAHKRETLRELIDAAAGDMVVGAELADLLDTRTPRAYLEQLAPFRARARLVDDDQLGRELTAAGTVIFEGAQGVLLDERHGTQPYTTWSNCTHDNALALLKESAFEGRVTKLGVVRAYATRHGPGPFVTEDHELAARIPDLHNGDHPWQGPFRVGWFDAVATRYAIAACRGIDALAVTCLDRLEPESVWMLCHQYQPDPLAIDSERPVYRVSAGAGSFDEKVEAHLQTISTELGTRVTLASFGPTAADKRRV